VTQYQLLTSAQAERDIQDAYRWHEEQRRGLGKELVAELRVAFYKCTASPLVYQPRRGGVRRVLLRRFPYAVYFPLEEQLVEVFAVLHVRRNPSEWQRRVKR
jgi:toxin ParE1/3/4